MKPPKPGLDVRYSITVRQHQSLRNLIEAIQVLPRRWVVERTFGWLNLQRRLSKDYEALCETTETWIYIAMTGLTLRRLARLPHF